MLCNKFPKSAGAGQYCPKILRVPGTRGTRTNSSPDLPKIGAQLLITNYPEHFSKILEKAQGSDLALFFED